MKSFKQAAVVIATVGMVSMQAHAGEAAVKTSPAITPMAAFSQQDINGLFDQADRPMQLAALSKQEMKETEGALAPWVIPAFAGGLYNGITYYSSTPNRSWSGWATAIGSGVAGGALGSVRWWSAPIWGGAITLGGSHTAGKL